MLLYRREGNAEQRSGNTVGNGFNSSVVGSDDAADDRQSQPQIVSTGLRRKERFKNLFHQCRLDTGSIIFDLQTDSFLELSPDHNPLIRLFHAIQRLHSVDQQIDDHFFQRC